MRALLPTERDSIPEVLLGFFVEGMGVLQKTQGCFSNPKGCPVTETHYGGASVLALLDIFFHIFLWGPTSGSLPRFLRAHQPLGSLLLLLLCLYCEVSTNADREVRENNWGEMAKNKLSVGS